ncbi:hypothetical protein [Thermotoga sp.]|uniref:hypothetical protein n=1 Tax=Thermotoga sp. TaxID=28240 RepID=UPI00345AF316
MIDPCIPEEWESFKVVRKFRGTTYEIEVKNPFHVSKDVKEIIVDGEKIKGQVLPLFNDGKTHKVQVTMG